MKTSIIVMLILLASIALAAMMRPFVDGLVEGDQSEQRQRQIDAIHRRIAAEKARWESLTPAQRAAETKAREDALAQQRAADEKAAADRHHADFIASARATCKASIESMLNDPFSAKFTPSESWPMTDRGDGTLTIMPQLRAKNGFGAYIYSAWLCKARDEGAQLRILSLSQL